MNSGQTLLTIAAIILLGTTVLTVNRNSVNNGTILRQTELGIYAVSLATSYIQRAAGLDYDEYTVGGLAKTTVPMYQPPSIPTGTVSGVRGDLTPVDSLGPDKYNPVLNKAETVNYDNTYDDFDDYNGFVKDTAITDVDNFHISAKVYYVSQTSPFTKVTANTTWFKQMDIKVNNTIDRKVYTGKSGIDTIQMSYIQAYYK